MYATDTITGLEEVYDYIMGGNWESEKTSWKVKDAIDLITELQIENAKLEHSRDALYKENQIEISSNNDLRQINVELKAEITKLITINYNQHQKITELQKERD